MALPEGFTLQSSSAPDEVQKPSVPAGFTLQEPKAPEATVSVPKGFTLQEPKAEEAQAPGNKVDFHKDALKEIGFKTEPTTEADIINQLAGPLTTTNPKVNQAVYEQAQKNFDFASTEAQKALRSGATKEQAADIFVNKLQAVAQATSGGNIRYPDSTLQAIKNAFTRGGLEAAAQVANLGALGAGAVGADTTSRELLGKAQSLEDIAAQYPGQFGSTQEALAKGTDLGSKVQNLAMRAMEGTIENAPSMIESMGGASGAKLLAEKGLEAFSKKFGKQVTEDMLEKAGRYGIAAGAFGASTALESSSIYKDIYDKTGQLRPAVAVGYGSLAGALDAIVPAQAVNTLAKKELLDNITKSIVQRYGVDALKNMGEEGATEFLQTFLEKGGVNYVDGSPVFTKGNLDEALDAAFIGTFMGGATHLSAQAIQDLAMKTQGMTREEAKQFYEAHQAAEEETKLATAAADAAKKRALGKWKTEGLTQKQKQEVASAVEAKDEMPAAEVVPPVVAEPNHDELVKQYIAQGQTKENANLLAAQDIADFKEAKNAGRIDRGTTGEGIEIPGQPTGEPVAGGAVEPIGATVAGAGIPAGTIEEGTLPQPATLEENPLKNPDGTPKVLYHGTDKVFDTFDESKIQRGTQGKGFYFSDNPQFAKDWGPNVMPVEVNADNPLVIQPDHQWTQEEIDAINSNLKKGPWDAVVRMGANNQITEVMVPKADQLKIVSEEPTPEQAAPEEPPVQQATERERAAAERLRQQQEEAAAAKAAAIEEAKRSQVGAPPKEIAAEKEAPVEAIPEEGEELTPEEETTAPVTTAEEDANFEKAKDNVGAFIRQTVGGVQNIAPEEVVSVQQALTSLADIMHYVIKKGARNFAQAMAQAKQGLGAYGAGITKKQYKAAYDAAKTRIRAEPKRVKPAKVDNIILKLNRSESPEDMGGAISEFLEADSWDDKKQVLQASWDTLTSKGIYNLLPALTTSQITDWVGNRIPHLTQVTRYVEKMSVMRSKMLASIADTVSPWADLAKKSISQAKLLSRVMHYATLSEVDPSTYNNLQEALAKDSQLLALRKKMSAASNPRERAAYKGQITTREGKLTTAYKLWNDLGPEGQSIFNKVRDHYRTTFNLHRAILDERIQKSSVPGSIDDASTPKGRLMAAIRQTYEDAKQIGVYFPLMRYGNYWMSFGSGVNKEFYMFESETQRNLFLNKRIRELQKAGDTRTKNEILESGEFDAGNDLTKLRNMTAEASEMLQGIFKIIDTQGVDNKEELKDAVYQMYLMTMPEQSFRKQFIHRKGTTGFSGDALRNFVRSGYASAGQLSRLKFGPDITNELDAAHASLEGMPPADKVKLGLFLNEIGMRVGEELAPDIEDQTLNRIANGVNQAAFLWRLTSPKSAFANMTAIPIFGLPVLASHYGELKAAAALAKYYNVFNHTTFVNPDGEYTPLSVGMSNHVQSNPVLAAAFEEAAERGITEITRTYDLVAMARTPSTTHQSALSRGVRAGINLAGILFHHSERLNREVMFMTSFELAYNKAVGEGLSGGVNGAAFNRAIDEAVKNTYDSMFNYTKYNRPRIMRKPTARVIFQFKLFPQQVTAYLIRNFVTMLKGSKLNPRARREATTQLVGTLMMTGLFAGIVGLPLYSTIIGVIQGLRDAFRDKDDPIPIEERDLNLWFRMKWLPEHFGEAAKYFEKGPISVATNIDIGSSTSLNNLWFRDSKYDASTANEFNDFLINAAGPGASLVQDGLKAYDDFRTGHFNEGVEKLLPAFAKGLYTQYVWGQEGIKVKGSQADILDKYEINKVERFWKAFGFNPTELTRIQEANYPAMELVQKAKDERKKIMNRLDLELSRGDDVAFEKALEDAVRFSLANPQKDLRIDGQTIAKSAIARAKLRAMADHGLIVPASLMPQLYDLVSASRPNKVSKAEMQRQFEAKMKANEEAEADANAESEEE